MTAKITIKGVKNYSATEAAFAIGCTAQTLYNWVRSGRVEAVKRRPTLISGREILRIISELSNEAEKPKVGRPLTRNSI